MGLAKKEIDPVLGKNDRDVVVSVRNVSKKFCMKLRRSMAHGIVDLSKNLFGIRPNYTVLRKDEFWAIKNISFELRKGETLGLIGVNGSGKTTLLRLLAGIFPPDKGEIVVRGRVGALIAVGAGFHPYMTGRENIYLNGSILGMRREKIESKFQDIVDFAEIGDFIDAPVSTYSSGMRVRLGFSIATAIEPSILLLDEILAVGDAKFRNKCYNRIGKIADNAAVIFVSHHMEQIAQSCSLCLNLSQGRVVYFGNVQDGVQRYFEENTEKDLEANPYEKIIEPVKSLKIEWSELSIKYGETIELKLIIDVFETMIDNILRVVLYNLQGVIVAEWNSKRICRTINLQKGSNIVRINIGPIYLKNGEYKFGITLNDSSSIREVARSFKQYSLKVTGFYTGLTAYQLPGHLNDSIKLIYD